MKQKRRLGKKAVSLLLSTAMAIELLPGFGMTSFADDVEVSPTYGGGSGTESDPWKISSVDDWKTLIESVSGGETYSGQYFRQTADLDMSSVEGLAPVGNLEVPFSGNYEGDGFAISGAKINGTTSTIQNRAYTVAAIFGVVEGGGSITNLQIKDSEITSTYEGSGQTYAGGLVGLAENFVITDCSVVDSEIEASSTSSTAFCGGIAGFASVSNNEMSTEFSKCASENNTVTSNVYNTNSSTSYNGGFVGAIINLGNSDLLSFTDCYVAKNSITAAIRRGQRGVFLGGSQMGSITLTNCFIYDSSITAADGSASLFNTGNGTVYANNTYYYDKSTLPVNATTPISKTETEMRSLAAELGEAFTQGDDYPVLLHPVNLEVSMEGWTYGDDVNEPVVSRNSGSQPAYSYAVKGTTDFSPEVPTNAGEYTVKAAVEETSTHKAAEAYADFTVAQAPLSISVLGYNAVYDGNAHGITVDVNDADAVVYYGTEELTAENYKTAGSTDSPTYTNAGDHTVFYYVVASENYTSETPNGSAAVSITKEDIEVTAPTANKLTYNGSAQELVKAGKASAGTMQYALGTSDKKAPASGYSDKLPTATDAGTYYVWYKVVGDENHNDTEPVCVTVKINRLSIKNAKVMVRNKTYTGKALKPGSKIIVNGKRLKKGVDYTITFKNNKNVGVGKAVIKGIGNYTGKVTTKFNIRPKKAAIKSVSSPKAKQLKVTWKKTPQATGYQIKVSTSKDFKTKNLVRNAFVKNNSTFSKTFAPLKSGKVYYVKIRAYKQTKSGKIYGQYSAVKKIKVK